MDPGPIDYIVEESRRETREGPTIMKKRKCLKCQYEWYPRKPGRPHVCPRPSCHSVKWDEPKDRVKIESK